MNALAEAQKNAALLGQAAFRFNVKACDLPSKIDDMMANVKALEKQLEQLKSQMASRMGDTLLEKAIEVKGIKVLAARMDGARRQGPARNDGQGQGQARHRRGRPRRRQRRRPRPARRGRQPRPHRPRQGRRTRQLRRAEARRQGRRQADMAMAGAQSAEGLDAALADVQAWVEAKL